MRGMILSGMFVVVALLGLAFALSWRSADQQRLEEARKANCLAIEQLKEIQRNALLDDIASTRTFLADNPEGVPGISPEVIRAGIARDQKQLAALAPTEC